jgi:predicted transcriptional regulator
MAAFSLRLPHELERRLGEEARHCGQPRSELIREALEELLRRREQERFMAGLVAAAEALASEMPRHGPKVWMWQLMSCRLTARPWTLRRWTSCLRW